MGKKEPITAVGDVTFTYTFNYGSNRSGEATVPAGKTYIIHKDNGGCSQGGDNDGTDTAKVETNELGQIRAAYSDSCRTYYDYGQWVDFGQSSCTQLIGTERYIVTCTKNHLIHDTNGLLKKE